MIKWMSLILLVIFLSSCFTLSFDSNVSVNPIQPAVGHYSNGQLRFKGEYYNGYRHGTWTDWNGNGDTISIVNYNQGELSGFFKIWELEKSFGNNSQVVLDYALDYGEIIIKEGVWIGAKSIILQGVIAESHAILSAGSVISKNLEKFSIYKGNPALKVSSRTIS